MISAVVATLGKFMLPIFVRRRTQVVKGEVCKTSMQRFESARRLQILLYWSFLAPPTVKMVQFWNDSGYEN